MSIWSPAIEIHATGWAAVCVATILILAAVDALLAAVSYIRNWNVMWGRDSK
jgi:hypothetical protein